MFPGSFHSYGQSVIGVIACNEVTTRLDDGANKSDGLVIKKEVVGDSNS